MRRSGGGKNSNTLTTLLICTDNDVVGIRMSLSAVSVSVCMRFCGPVCLSAPSAEAALLQRRLITARSINHRQRQTTPVSIQA